MKFFLNIKLLFLLIFLPVSYSIADIKETKNSDQNNQKYTESSDLEGIHEALSIFSRSNTQDNLIYDQKRREMLDSVEERFVLCDLDNDQTLDVYETTHCLPQVARKFREVDTDNDFLITLDEMSILAKDYIKTYDQPKNSSDTKIADDGKKELDAILEGGKVINIDNKSL